ncbi:2-hydroxychromene-2-carboxylate isomerase [Ruegeria marina]|uniref:2-hydroxychromene-2-carboxylate isomerase n=1 Tax=Ruegeria marina TaxID=639004 RepID=A0A1G6IMK6_9RHOB|nr:2-hydroxychromene-2-carboxylate isomerase [Ruegeria marina]SDC07704.1 2-hydroxychromene-2-carboxylate isomerase [Ruegeria marina]
MKEIEFVYDFGSPNAYLVHRVLPDLAARHGAAVRPSPVLLGGIFKATNNQSPMEAFSRVRHKLTYQARELQRFVRRHGLVFHMNPHFPVNTLLPMRGAVFARGKEWENSYIDAIFNAMWVHGQNPSERHVFEEVLREAGLPVRRMLEAVDMPETKQALVDATAVAVERGVFGAPSMLLGDELFFGKDSLPDLEYELEQAG